MGLPPSPALQCEAVKEEKKSDTKCANKLEKVTQEVSAAAAQQERCEFDSQSGTFCALCISELCECEFVSVMKW